MQRVLTYFIALIVSATLLFALYTWASLTWVYSTGERAGYIQKFSKKGWVCKTYEGEIVLVSMPGTQAEKFLFTVRDETVAKKIDAVLGKRMKLIYDEHRGVPSTCFGETAYFVHDVQALE